MGTAVPATAGPPPAPRREHVLRRLAAAALATLLAAAGMAASANQRADGQEEVLASEADPGPADSAEFYMPGADQLFAAPLRTGATPARWGRPLPQGSRHPAGAGAGPAAAAARDGGRHLQNGIASWYGDRFHGRRTASGERFDMHAMTAAHRTLPMRSEVRIHNPANGRSVTVRINDRGPFHAGRMIDLSYGAALRLGLLQAPAMVEMWRTGQGHEQADQDRGHRDDAGHLPAAPVGDDAKPAVVAPWLWETAFPAGSPD